MAALGIKPGEPRRGVGVVLARGRTRHVSGGSKFLPAFPALSDAPQAPLQPLGCPELPPRPEGKAGAAEVGGWRAGDRPGLRFAARASAGPQGAPGAAGARAAGAARSSDRSSWKKQAGQLFWLTHRKLFRGRDASFYRETQSKNKTKQKELKS